MISRLLGLPGEWGAEGWIGGEAGDGGVVVSPSGDEGESGSHPHPHSVLQRLRLHRGPRADGLPPAVVHPLNLFGVGRRFVLGLAGSVSVRGLWKELKRVTV